MGEEQSFPGGSEPLDIVDSQYHLGQGEIDSTLRAMDALGIRSLLLDEFWGQFGGSHPTHIQPGYLLDNGAWRAAWPTAELAGMLHPERFSYVVRIDPLDPELESVMRTVGSSPHARAFRLQPVWTLEEVAAFTRGSHDHVLDLAQDIGLPVSVFIPGYVELLAPYVKKFSRLTFIIDHCGMGYPNIPPGRPESAARKTLQPSYLEVVGKLAEFSNVALKWSHTQNLLGAPSYPYEPLRPLLRQMIEAFGKERILWASDNSVIPNHSWSDMLYYLREDPELTRSEKEWILGGSARHILHWPAASRPL